LRVALVHDWLTGLRGGERVLEAFCELFPEADIFTLVHAPGSTSERIDEHTVHASFLSQVPGITRHYRAWLPLFPAAARSLDLHGYDLIVSCSHAVAKSIRVPAGARHLSYCFTPMRYVWDQRDAYLGRGLARLASAPLVSWLRHFDRRHSGPDEVHRFVAISTAVRDRIRNHYGREAGIVHPPVDTERFQPDGRDPEVLLLGVDERAAARV
jgi:glycosyltransferase involved in cell wall biosynthesis